MKYTFLAPQPPTTNTPHPRTSPFLQQVPAKMSGGGGGDVKVRCTSNLHTWELLCDGLLGWQTRDLFRSSESFFFEPTTPTFAPPSHTHTHYPCARSHISPFLPTPFFCPSQVVVR
jgi:hypothetical protein